MTYKQAYCKACGINHRLISVSGGWKCHASKKVWKNPKWQMHWLAKANSLKNKVGRQNIAGLRQNSAGLTKVEKQQSQILKGKQENPATANSSQPTSPPKKLTEYEEYLQAIKKKTRLCIHCSQPIETIRSKGAKYCKACAEKINTSHQKYVKKVKK